MPKRVWIGDAASIGIRSTIIAHFRAAVHGDTSQEDDRVSVRIEDEAFIGPGAIILPGVTIGRGAVVTAGSVVSSSVPPLTMVQGNPARPVARCGVPLGLKTPLKAFYRSLKPLRTAPGKAAEPRPPEPSSTATALQDPAPSSGLQTAPSRDA